MSTETTQTIRPLTFPAGREPQAVYFWIEAMPASKRERAKTEDGNFYHVMVQVVCCYGLPRPAGAFVWACHTRAEAEKTLEASLAAHPGSIRQDGGFYGKWRAGR